jgi:glycosyltransferase involved in cell wall biosynthesis
LKIVAICQDVIPLTHPQFFQSGEFVTRYRTYVDFLLHDADLLIAHSNAVSGSLQMEAERSGLPVPKIAIVPLGSDIATKITPRQPATEPPLHPGGFVIAVSTVQSRKNFDLLWRVWHRFAEEGRRGLPRLVIVGAPGFGGAELLNQIGNDLLVKDRIIVLHDAHDAELDWLYRNCRFTLYPSFAEGWGLPVSESLAYGKPCLASNTTSLPEAGAGFAVHLDPLDLEAWHDTILAWSTDQQAIDAMARDIRTNYRPTSWAQTSAALARELRCLID